jgi:hypothetical protein
MKFMPTVLILSRTNILPLFKAIQANGAIGIFEGKTWLEIIVLSGDSIRRRLLYAKTARTRWNRCIVFINEFLCIQRRVRSAVLRNSYHNIRRKTNKKNIPVSSKNSWHIPCALQVTCFLQPVELVAPVHSHPSLEQLRHRSVVVRP